MRRPRTISRTAVLPEPEAQAAPLRPVSYSDAGLTELFLDMIAAEIAPPRKGSFW